VSQPSAARRRPLAAGGRPPAAAAGARVAPRPGWCCTGGVTDFEPNALIVGGPQPIGSRELHADLDAWEVRASAADGSGLHVWRRTSRMEPRQGRGWLRVYVYFGRDDQPIPM